MTTLFRALFIAACALAIALLVGIFWLGRATAADIHPTPQERAACGADAQRFCKAGGDIVACLQSHRASLSKSCAALLLERGL